MKPTKITYIILFGLFLADAASARIWIGKNGSKIEAEYVKFDSAAKTVTIRQGDIEHKVALDNLSEDDQKWVAGQGAAPAEEKPDDAAGKGASDEILLLLNKTPKEVSAALKTLKMVEDMEKFDTAPRQSLRDGSMGFRHSYDSGKVTLEYFGDKLATINLHLIDGYAGPIPFGLKKGIGQMDAQVILEKQDFKLKDWGTTPPGWGLAYNLNSSPDRVVSIITMEPKSPELAIIRIMQKKPK